MRLSPILAFLLPLVLFSCSRSNPGPSGNGSTDTTSRPNGASYSWKIIGKTASSQPIIDIWFTSPSKGFAAVADGYLWQSLDSGKTWTRIPNTYASTANSLGMSNLFFANSTYGFAQGLSQLQVTKDGGNTWSLLSLPTSKAYNIFFTSPSTGYYGDIDGGLYKTTDSGKTWISNFKSTRTGVDYPVHFLTPDKGFVLCGDATFSKTGDGAASWQQVQKNIFVTGTTTPGYNTLQFVDDLTGFYASQNGVFKTIDGGQTWKNVYPNGSNVNVIKFFDATTGYYKADRTIYKTTDGGQTWTTSYQFTTSDTFIGMFFIDSTNGWASTSLGSVLRKEHQ